VRKCDKLVVSKFASSEVDSRTAPHRPKHLAMIHSVSVWRGVASGIDVLSCRFPAATRPLWVGFSSAGPARVLSGVLGPVKARPEGDRVAAWP
jgi:hypothetical protein